MFRIFQPFRISALAAVLLLSACSISAGIPAATSRASLAVTRAESGALLYVANGSATAGVSILTFPQGKLVATISNIGGPQGVCADKSGHVWITAYLKRDSFALYEFARGATTPLRTIHRKNWLATCTVDPSGNLVVLTFLSGTAYAGSVEVWPPSLHGKPHVTPIPMEADSGAYDAGGNLYLKGYQGSDPAFAVLSKSSSKLTWLHLKNGNDFADGCLGWDGTYLTLAAYTRRPVIYRLTVNGRIAKVASIVRLQHLADAPEYALAGTAIVSTRGGSDATHIGIYDYPAGGKPTAVFSGFYKPRQIAISSE